MAAKNNTQKEKVAEAKEVQMVTLPAADLQRVLDVIQGLPFKDVYTIIPLVMQAKPVEK